MLNKNFIFCIILLLVLWLTELKAQEAIPATGGNVSGSGGSMSYTVGQIVYTTNTGTNGSVAQGVQQPYEISVVTGLKEANGIDIICSVYPNPTNDDIKLKVEDFELSNLNFQLYDISGKLLENYKIEVRETTIPMKNLVHATYFLKVTNNDKDVKTFKIVKN